MSMKPPWVKVIIPTFNRPHFLSQAVGSVIGKRMTDWEVLVINGGGMDVGVVVNGFGDARVRRVRNQANRGKAAYLKQGLEMARGGLIAYLDDDDLRYPNHLAVLCDALQHTSVQAATWICTGSASSRARRAVGSTCLTGRIRYRGRTTGF